MLAGATGAAGGAVRRGLRTAHRSSGARRAAGRRQRLAGAGAALIVAVGITGCGGQQSIAAPRSHQTHVIALVWWWMLGTAVVVFAGAIGLLVIAFIRRHQEGLP